MSLRSKGANSGKVINIVPELPKDAIVVTRPDGTTIDDPKSPTKKLMAPPQANFQEVYAAGEQIANWPLLQQIDEARTALQQFGTYDFQRDKATNTWFSEYVHAANYAVGVYMAGAGYGLYQSLALAQAYAVFNSSNAFDDKYKGREWKIKGWEDTPEEIGVKIMARAQVDSHFFFHCLRANCRLVLRSDRLSVAQHLRRYGAFPYCS